MIPESPIKTASEHQSNGGSVSGALEDSKGLAAMIESNRKTLADGWNELRRLTEILHRLQVQEAAVRRKHPVAAAKIVETPTDRPVIRRAA